MSKKNKENSGFTCEHCKRDVLPLTNGSYRNHCPFCLCSKHVDFRPGDRLNDCQGIMDPVGITYKSGKGFQIIHSCEKCKKSTVNKVAEHTVQPDTIDKIIQLQVKPMRLMDRR